MVTEKRLRTYNMETMEILKRMRTTLGLNRRSRGEWRTNPTLTYLARPGPPQPNRAWLIRGQAGNGVSQRNWVTVGLIYSARDLEIGRAEECEDKDLRDGWNRKAHSIARGWDRKRKGEMKRKGEKRKKKKSGKRLVMPTSVGFWISRWWSSRFLRHGSNIQPCRADLLGRDVRRVENHTEPRKSAELLMESVIFQCGSFLEPWLISRARQKDPHRWDSPVAILSRGRRACCATSIHGIENWETLWGKPALERGDGGPFYSPSDQRLFGRFCGSPGRTTTSARIRDIIFRD